MINTTHALVNFVIDTHANFLNYSLKRWNFTKIFYSKRKEIAPLPFRVDQVEELRIGLQESGSKWTWSHKKLSPLSKLAEKSLRKHAYSNILKILPPKDENFQMKNYDIPHISAQNIDCGYALEPPRRGGSNAYPQSMFLSRNKKNNVYPCKPFFTI